MIIMVSVCIESLPELKDSFNNILLWESMIKGNKAKPYQVKQVRNIFFKYKIK